MASCPSNLSEKGKNRRTQILKKAAQEFANRGYHATSVADILDGMDIARGTFYQYFANKRSIFDEILNDLLNKISAAIRVVDVNHPEITPLEQGIDMLVDILRILMEDRSMAKVLVNGTMGSDQEFDQRIHDFYGNLKMMIRNAIELGQRMDLIRNIDADFISVCILGAFKELVNDSLEKDEASPDLRKMADSLINCVAHGISTGKGS
jgi:AcrR family transcriptional regulator